LLYLLYNFFYVSFILNLKLFVMEKYFGDFIPWCTFVAKGEEIVKETISLFKTRLKDNTISTHDDFLKNILEHESCVTCGQKYSMGFIPTKGTNGSDCLKFIVDNNYLLLNIKDFISFSVNLEEFIKNCKIHTSVFCIDDEDKLSTYFDKEFSFTERKQIPVLCKRKLNLNYFLGDYEDSNFHENYILCIKKE